MKHWKETAEIFARAELQEAGRKVAIATVVRIEGSAYRRPGAKFLVDAEGGASGSISGGCLEADVREIALRVIREDAPTLLHYDTGADDHSVWGLGLAAAARSTSSFSPRRAHSGDGLSRPRASRGRARSPCRPSSRGRRVSVPSSSSRGMEPTRDRRATGPRSRDRPRASQLLSRRETRLHAAGAAEVFTEVFVPPPHLVIFGAGDDAIPLCSYAADVGFRVFVVDHRGGYLARPGSRPRRASSLRPEDGTSSLPLGPNDYAVVKTHPSRTTANGSGASSRPASPMSASSARARAPGNFERSAPPDRSDLRARGPRPRRRGSRAGRVRDRRGAPAVRSSRDPASCGRNRERSMPADASGPVAAWSWRAGTSTRMGQNKLLFRLGGETSSAARSPPALGGARPGHRRPGARSRESGDELSGLSILPVFNPEYARGINRLLQTGIASVPEETSAAVVMLADMPMVTDRMVASLVERYRESRPDRRFRLRGVQAPPTLYSRSVFRGRRAPGRGLRQAGRATPRGGM